MKDSAAAAGLEESKTMALHVYEANNRTLTYYDTAEEIPGYNPANPKQVQQVPAGHPPMSGHYMVVSPFNPEPWAIKEAAPFSHLSEAWIMVYASGGYQGRENYQAREPGIADAANPSFTARAANQELSREADRYVGDVETAEVRAELLELDAVRFDIAERAFRGVGYDLVFYRHVVNRPSEGRPDVVATLFAVPQLPSRDRNSRHSRRLSVQRWEILQTFIDNPDGVMRELEEAAVQDGFCVDLKARTHAPITIARNARNCVKLALAGHLDGG